MESIQGVEPFNKKLYVDPIFESSYTLNNKRATEVKTEAPENLFVSVRGYLILGRFLGIVPLCGVFSKSHNSLSFRLFSIAVAGTLCICIIIGLSVVLAAIRTLHEPKSNALEIARSVQPTFFQLWSLYLYFYFVTRSEAFLNIFTTWEKTSLHNPLEDRSLHRDAIIIPSLVFTSAIIEYLIGHMEFLPQFDNINSNAKFGNATSSHQSFLEVFYWRACGSSWGKYLGYHPLLAVWSFVAHALCMASVNYVDVLMIIFARALYFRFRRLCEVAVGKLGNKNVENGSMKVECHSAKDQWYWVQIVQDHEALCSLLEAFEYFLSPLIFGSYTVNIYYICMQLMDGLSPVTAVKSLVHSIYALWSFFHLSMRIFLLSITAAKINRYAHDIGIVLKKCPIKSYTMEVARVDKHVTSGPDIGFSGLGCFVVTKPFILSILNVIFTVEIVLLQGLSSATGPCPTAAPK